MRLSIILTSVAWVFGRTSAATTTLNSTVLSPSPDFTANAQTPGPLFLDQVIPLRLYLGAGNTPAAGQFSETSDLQNSICPNGGQFNYKLNSNANNAIMTSANIFIIYYSNGKISSSHSKSIQNFVANIGSTNYWNKVLQYTYNGTPAKPVFTTSVSINPSTQKSYGTSMQAGNAQDLLLYVFTANPNLKDVNGLYVIILGTDITFTKDSNVMGKGTNSVGTDIYCGIHDIYICTTALNNGCTINGNNVNYRYMVVGMPKGFSNGDKCSGIFPFQTPNSDSSLDHSIYFIAHEVRFKNKSIELTATNSHLVKITAH